MEYYNGAAGDAMVRAVVSRTGSAAAAAGRK